jgi:hypothetical protein
MKAKVEVEKIRLRLSGMLTFVCLVNCSVLR